MDAYILTLRDHLKYRAKGVNDAIGALHGDGSCSHPGPEPRLQRPRLSGSLQVLCLHYLGPTGVSLPDRGALHYEAEGGVQRSFAQVTSLHATDHQCINQRYE